MLPLVMIIGGGILGLVGLLAKHWRLTGGITLLTLLRKDFCKLPMFIQHIVKIILALVPTGLLAVMLYAKYISYLDSAALSQQPVKCLIAIFISMFGIIIFVLLFWIITQLFKLLKISPIKWITNTTKKIWGGLTRIMRPAQKAIKIAGGKIVKGVKLTVGTSVKGIKVVGKSIKKGTTHTVKGVGKLGGITRKFRRKKKRSENNLSKTPL